MSSPRSVIVICLVVVLNIGCKQKPPTNKTENVTRSKTAKHQNIPGTRVFIIPPAGFTPSSSLPALESEDEGLIQAMDMDGGNFHINAANISPENYAAAGVEVFDYQETEVNGFPAKMAFVQADPQTKMFNLVFGDSTFSVNVMGLFPTESAAMGEKIKTALASIFYDKSFKVDLFSIVPFKLDDSGSLFKFAHSFTSSFVYSLGGIKKDSYKGEPFMTVVPMPREGETLQQLGDGMANITESRSVRNVDSSDVNGLPSLRREIHGTMNGEAIHIYQHIVAIGRDAVVIQGITEKDFNKFLPEFKKLSNTIRAR